MTEILIYGEITDSGAEYYVDEIRAADEVRVRINSAGGSVFAALAIHSALRQKAGDVLIEGLCASAATLIACAGKHIAMASNALMMIHNPKVLLADFYDSKGLEAVKVSLSKVEESILSTYKSRVADFEMPSEELWLTAREAKAAGFIDEITEEVEMRQRKGLLFVNGLLFDVRKYKMPAVSDTRKNTVISELGKMIMDQIESGAAQVEGASFDEKERQIEMVAAYANGVTR